MKKEFDSNKKDYEKEIREVVKKLEEKKAVLKVLVVKGKEEE